MATRVIKNGSASVEFTVAPEPLHIEDLDSDLDAIFSDINDSNIPPGANISGAKLADATTPITKLLPSAPAVANVTPSLAITTVEMAVATLPSFTPSVANVRLEVLGPVILNMATGAAGFITIRWYEDGVLIATIIISGINNSAGATIEIPMQIPGFLRLGATLAPHVYSVTAQTSTVSITVASGATFTSFAAATNQL